ncbi:MAG: hypothetical protein RMJ38_03390 [candidate division WOR-3 bacterium]|nr:hypothetical protein [candidate division WOR-3 bacterium]MDW8150466.1 hypothetical protein [candidate division WOR-3 bacterium]
MVRILFVSLFFLMISCKKKSETSSSCEQPATNLSGIWKGSWVLPPDPPYNSQTGQICTRIVQTGSLIDGKLYDMDNSSQFFDSVDIKGNICGSVVNLRTDTMVYFNIKIIAKFNGNVVYDTSGGTFKIQAPQNNYESSDGTWWMKRDTAASCK